MPYDLKELASDLKNEGLDLAEDGARKAVKAVFGWVKASAKASANKYDDMAVALLAPLEAYVMEQIDKIDGEVDEAPEADAS